MKVKKNWIYLFTEQTPTFHFTVGELIKALHQFPDDLPVLVSGYETGYENFLYPIVHKVVYEPENPYYDGQFQISDTNGMEVLLLNRELRE
jgi:hypothetical protein